MKTLRRMLEAPSVGGLLSADLVFIEGVGEEEEVEEEVGKWGEEVERSFSGQSTTWSCLIK